jgi:paraquat-inducible protein B
VGSPRVIPAAQPVVTRTRWHLPLVWIVPIVSAVIALSLLVRHVVSTGPEIQVFFQTAEGLEVDKTQVKFKDVPIGIVNGIRESDDLSHVVVSIDLHRSARIFARSDTRFWVVRPRVGLGGISGIGTLISGAYIEADPGKGGAKADTFIGLEEPPAVTSASHGTQFTLHSDNLGSLDLGSPVYYRRLKVGQVVSYALDSNGQGVTIGIFIDSPNNRYVGRSTRFWNASGIDVSLGADGFKLSTQSLASVAAGGIAFYDPPWAQNDRVPAPSGTRFELLKDESAAMEKPKGEPLYIAMKFEKDLRGLSVNAPVEFVGVEIGKVLSISIDYDPKTQHFPIIVGAVIYPQLLGRVFEDEMTSEPQERGRRIAAMMTDMVARGLRAQARNGNLLTGQLYIAIDFLPRAAKVAFDGSAQPIQIPTAPGALDNVQQEISDIVAKIDKIPFDSIGQHLDQDLSELKGSLDQLNKTILPDAGRTLADARKTVQAATDVLTGESPLRQDVEHTLEELRRSARSLRVLTEYLSRHPESLIRGKPKDLPPELAAPTDAAPVSSPPR